MNKKHIVLIIALLCSLIIILFILVQLKSRDIDYYKQDLANYSKKKQVEWHFNGKTINCNFQINNGLYFISNENTCHDCFRNARKVVKDCHGKVDIIINIKNPRLKHVIKDNYSSMYDKVLLVNDNELIEELSKLNKVVFAEIKDNIIISVFLGSNNTSGELERYIRINSI